MPVKKRAWRGRPVVQRSPLKESLSDFYKNSHQICRVNNNSSNLNSSKNSGRSSNKDEWHSWLSVVRNFYREHSRNGRTVCDRVKLDVDVTDVAMLWTKKHGDNRPYIKVEIMGDTVVALLDTGATDSVFGKAGLDFVKKFDLKIFPCGGGIDTADGVGQNIKGYVTVPVKVGNVVRIAKILVVPSLVHKLILASDFCKTFGVVVDYVAESWYSADSTSKPLIWEVRNVCPEVNSVQSRSSLSVAQNRELEAVIKNFKELSWMSGSKLGRTTKIVHKIDTGDAEPVKQRHHNMSPYMLEHLYNELDKMLTLGVVRPSSSPWASPVLLVKKSNGDLRFCFDGRKLNNLTKKDAYPLPHVDHILSKLTGAKYLSSIDLKAAFWQIPLEASSCEKTAFVVPSRGLFEFVVMPFGLNNAAQTQQRLMDTVFGYKLEPFVFVYLDDIIVATPTFEQHIEVLSEVFHRLKDANLTINLEKCEFCLSSLRYLGFLIDSQGLRTDPEKVSAMLNYPRPQSVTELKRFCGLVGWYRRFIPSFSSLTAPITNLIKGKRKLQKIEWNSEADVSFSKIKEALVSAPILARPDFQKRFSLQCDASDVGVGCVLTQEGDDGNEVVIAFASRTLSQQEKKYTVTEKECLAVLFGVEKFRGYIEGTQVRVITDHYSLLWLNRLKDPSGRLARWAVRLQQYDLVIEHRKGSLNTVPDALSRAPLAEISLLSLQDSDRNGDNWYTKMVLNVQNSPEKFPDWMVKDGLLFKHIGDNADVNLNLPEWKMVVPKGRRKDVLLSCHDDPKSAHLGIYKTYGRVQQLYYWPKMRSYVKNYVNHCKICAAQKVNNTSRPGFMGKPKQVSFPWQVVSVDVMGPLPKSSKGFSYLLVVSDYFSKYVLLHPMRQANANTIIKYLENEVFLVYGTPQILTCDNATTFTCKDFQSLCKNYGVKIFFNARYHAQVNQVERVNRVVGTAIRSYIKEGNHKTWDSEIPKIGYALRTAVHEATSFSPVYLNFGRFVPANGKFYGDVGSDPNFNFEPWNRENYAKEISKLPKFFKIVQGHLNKAYRKNAHDYNLRKRPADRYNVGDYVWKKNYVLSSGVQNFAAKLAPKNILCRVHKVISPLVYELIGTEDNKNLGRWHVKDLKSYRGYKSESE